MKRITVEMEIRAKDLTEKMRQDAQARFVRWVAKEKGIDYYAALMICHGNSDPVDHEITLGYKMSDPVFMIAANLQRKTNREKAIENFKKTLSPEELIIFKEQVQTEKMRTHFRSKIKKEEKKKEVEE